MPHKVNQPKNYTALCIKIASCQQGIDKDCLTAQLSILDARLGCFEKASEGLNSIRVNSASMADIRRSIWINLAEGLLGYFGNFGENSSDGIKRALALSEAFNIRELQAISSAWSAQLSYSALNIEALEEQLNSAFKNAAPKDHDALSRASLVVAQSFAYGRRPDLARRWYEKSLYHATAEQDEITLSAILHNMAWLRMLNFRQSALSEPTVNLDRHMLLSAESMTSFGDMTGELNWFELRPILRAQGLSLGGRFSEALEQYAIAAEGMDRIERMQSNLLADQAYCFAMTGDHAKALEILELSLSRITNDVFVDDRASMHSRIATVMNICGRECDSKSHSAFARVLWKNHEIIQCRLITAVSSINFPRGQ